MAGIASRLDRRLAAGIGSALVVAAAAVLVPATATASATDLGPNVYIFNPSMPLSQIQAAVDAVSGQQVHNEFGTQRYALLFEPGSYGSNTHPLVFQLGYYTTVAGLGLSPNDVVINGAIQVFNNQCSPSLCTGLTNFWRSMSNLTINVTHVSPHPNWSPAPVDLYGPDCANSNEIWAVSQAAPMRRVQINGFTTLWDYCGPFGYVSGGFIADSKLNFVLNSSQQQYVTRNSKIDTWSNAVWNQVFSGVVGAPAQSFPNPTYTTLATSPVTREAPYFYVDAGGSYNVFVPSVQHGTAGTSWANSQSPGTSISIDKFFVAQPSDSAATINAAVQRGKNLILTPGIYHLNESLEIDRPDTVVLGLGMATLTPDNGTAAMTVANAKGILISGVLFDAGPVSSPALLMLGTGHARSDNDAADPSALTDVFFRVGGAAAGKTSTALVVNTSNAILDDIWAWRADHGSGVGWTSNTADTGVIVNGDNVTAYGLFVEHFQKYEVIWNGDNGTDVFFQNEMPYDVPSQAAWMEAPGVDGYAAFKVADGVSSFHGYGMGSYSFFNQGLNIYADHAFEISSSASAAGGVHLRDLLTIFLDVVHGKGGILHVVNETGGSSTAANPDTPVTVVSYP
ncbi:MAG TPA: adenylyl cyclase [Candidatus Dormibacteraeota bacterium]|nr:adenylyl cyclase [Candidatus Dormibacteraeota bacterium]